MITGEAANVASLRAGPDFTLLRRDVSEAFTIEGPLDAVLHFASPASPVDYAAHPIETLKVGTLGTHNLLELAMAKGATFLLASTSEVYGDPLVHPQPESYWGNVNPIGPRGVYDEAKRAAEAFAMAYHRRHGVRTRIARVFNSFGPMMRMNDGRAVPNFITQALAGKPLTVYGDGSQTRSLCYVDDLIEGVVRLLDCDDPMPVNLGNPQEMTMLELARLIKELTGSRSEIAFSPLPVDDPRQRRPDITRARQLLGWEPKIPPREGLAKTIEWFRQAGG
jgi:dTDP-glucose 4,6-dehydratase